MKRHLVWLAAALALVACACPLVGANSVTVMTRNLYLGGDITRPVRAALGQTGQDAILALGHANHDLREIVDRTDFGVRGQLIAGEIASARPDLLGLQEVALWRHGPIQLKPLEHPTATEVDYDFLRMLLTDLQGRRVRYDVVQAQQESDVEAPAFTGDPFTGTAASAEDVRLTVRDVILVRHGAGIRVTGSGGGQYQHQFSVQLAGAPFTFVRGFAWADIAVGPLRIRFITTHLESQTADIALPQAKELLAGPAGDPNLTTVVTCDCNSDPLDTAVRPGQTVPHSAPYQELVGAGFQDEWLQQTPPGGPGFTSGLSELVNDPTPAGFKRRLDLVLARAAPPAQVIASGGDITGDQLTDRDPATGLWPSDHAGVVLRLRIQ